MNPHRKKRASQCPLDSLSPAILADLEARVESPVTLAETRAWLAAQHGVKVSAKTLSEWRQRRARWRADRRINPGGSDPAPPMQSLCHGGLEIIVTAPGASEVRVQVRQLPSAP